MTKTDMHIALLFQTENNIKMKEAYKFLFTFIGLTSIFLIAFYFINPINEKIPDDVRYMLEDMYGSD